MTKVSAELLTWKKIAEKGEVAEEKARPLKLMENKLQLFNQDGYHAIDDLCVHQDGSIASGKLEEIS